MIHNPKIATHSIPSNAATRPIEGDPYPAAWADLLRRLRLLMAVYAAAIPGIAVVSWPLSRLIGEDTAIPVAVGVWMGIMTTCSISLNQFQCPRCNERFFTKVLFSNPWRSACCRCGLRASPATRPGPRPS